jgi:hypothetical protein
MKRILMAAFALALCVPAAAQLYKWVDKDGKTYYSDTPPTNQDTKQLNTGSGSSSSPAPAKGAVARDKELEKGREASRDAGKKSDDAAKLAASKDEACVRARQAYQTYADGGRLHKYNDKGERVMLEDSEIETERERARRDMDEACKK